MSTIQKELTISIPEGYEIDKEKSTFEKIVFKPVDSKIRSWEEYTKITAKDKWILLTDGIPRLCSSSSPIGELGRTVIFDSQEEAEAVHALVKLRLLRNQWVGDWESKDGEYSFIIKRPCSEDIRTIRTSTFRWLSFPTAKMADDFISTFRPLLEQAKLFL